jgi:hypothetical protein
VQYFKGRNDEILVHSTHNCDTACTTLSVIPEVSSEFRIGYLEGYKNATKQKQQEMTLKGEISRAIDRRYCLVIIKSSLRMLLYSL